MENMSLRRARIADLGALDQMFQRSYAKLLAADYPPSVLSLAVPAMARAKPDLIRSGRFHLIEEDGKILGAGGWSFETPGTGRLLRGIGHIRHVATDPSATRRGVGSRLLSHILGEMQRAGLTVAHCQSTRTAEPFYAAMGFAAEGASKVMLAGTFPFHTVFMRRSF